MQRIGTNVLSSSLDRIYRAGAWALRFHPRLRATQRHITIHRNVPYGPFAHQKLDVVGPRAGAGPCPIVLYMHGGGFNVLSKESHWMMATALALRGARVFNIDYRLAPRHPYPAALRDVMTAYAWLLSHAAGWGGRPPIVVAGESAGANLALSLSLAATRHRPEPGTRAVWALARPPDACLALCGLLQVTDTRRFRPEGWTAPAVRLRLRLVEAAYGAPVTGAPSLADPLRVLEDAPNPEGARRFPPTWVSVGTRDPLLDDSRRLKTALDRAGVAATLREYEGEPHAFQALLWRPQAEQAWDEIRDFVMALPA